MMQLRKIQKHHPTKIYLHQSFLPEMYHYKQKQRENNKFYEMHDVPLESGLEIYDGSKKLFAGVLCFGGDFEINE